MRAYELTESPKLIDHLFNDPKFLNWFGKSKVIDNGGNPLILFHGTGEDISEFKGITWGSVHPELASKYALLRGDMGGNSNVMPIFMKIENLFNADSLPKTVTVNLFCNELLIQATKHVSLDIAKQLLLKIRNGSQMEESGPHYSRHDFWLDSVSMFGQEGADSIMKLFQLVGFDGIKMRENGNDTYGAFSPNQVKSIYTNWGLK